FGGGRLGHRAGTRTDRAAGREAPFPALRRGGRLGSWACAEESCGRRGVGVAFDIATPSYTLFSHAMTPTPPDNAEWVRRKRNVTFRFHRSSYAIGLELTRDGKTMREKHGLRDNDYMAHGGCFPVRLVDSPLVIGAITVSGLPQREDHDLLTRTLAGFLGVSVDDIALGR